MSKFEEVVEQTMKKALDAMDAFDKWREENPKKEREYTEEDCVVDKLEEYEKDYCMPLAMRYAGDVSDFANMIDNTIESITFLAEYEKKDVDVLKLVNAVIADVIGVNNNNINITITLRD